MNYRLNLVWEGPREDYLRFWGGGPNYQGIYYEFSAKHGFRLHLLVRLFGVQSQNIVQSSRALRSIRTSFLITKACEALLAVGLPHAHVATWQMPLSTSVATCP